MPPRLSSAKHVESSHVFHERRLNDHEIAKVVGCSDRTVHKLRSKPRQPGAARIRHQGRRDINPGMFKALTEKLSRKSEH